MFIEIRTSELTDVALDWVVAKCEDEGFVIQRPELLASGFRPMPFSSNWTQGGPIIEREFISVDILAFNDQWMACKKQPAFAPACRMYGPTPLIAAMRCYVASKMGDVVEIPKELV